MYRLVVIDDEYIVVQGIKALISRNPGTGSDPK